MKPDSIQPLADNDLIFCDFDGTISVIDTGPGIPEAEQARIFDKFYQVDPTLTKQAHGTGLGLAIAKDLSMLLGGQLTLESSPGHGATFTLTLPIQPASPEGTAAISRPLGP